MFKSTKFFRLNFCGYHDYHCTRLLWLPLYSASSTGEEAKCVIMEMLCRILLHLCPVVSFLHVDKQGLFALADIYLKKEEMLRNQIGNYFQQPREKMVK